MMFYWNEGGWALFSLISSRQRLKNRFCTKWINKWEIGLLELVLGVFEVKPLQGPLGKALDLTLLPVVKLAWLGEW